MANAAQEKLEEFVFEALRAGKSRSDITQVLGDAEWTPDQIRSALRAYAEIEFPIPVPRPRPQLSSRDFFIYALLFTTLYLTAYYLGNLFFELINLNYPDPSESSYSFRDPHESLRWRSHGSVWRRQYFWECLIGWVGAPTSSPVGDSLQCGGWPPI